VSGAGHSRAVYPHIHTYTHIYTHTHIYTYIHIYNGYIHTYTRIYTHIDRSFVFTSVMSCINYVCMLIYIWIYV
jgi:hypothetical protein